jgi:hypothetical protein
MFTYILRPNVSLTFIGGCNIGRRNKFCHSTIFLQRISSSTRSQLTAQKPFKDGLSSPLPAPSISTSKNHIDPVKAKQRYLKSKQQTEEFLKDPQKKMNQLQAEINQVKERLGKEVYNKSVWQRLTDPLKRKQHSLINMIAATFAYILAYQLHLKRQSNQALAEEIQTQEEMIKNLKTLLRSLLDDDYIQDIATTVVSENTFMITEGNREKNLWSWNSAGTVRAAATERDYLSPALVDAMGQVLRSKLEERIGDDVLDDLVKKKRNIERILKENRQNMKSNGENHVAELLALAEKDEKEQERDNGTPKQRLFDM